MTDARARFFVAGVHELDAEIVLDAEAAHKLRTVLRARDGEEVELRDSGGRKLRAVIVSVRPELRVRVVEVDAEQRADGIAITLAQCLPKAAKMDYVVEKATELGVVRIIPVQSSRVIGDRQGSGKVDRWRRLAKTAAEQCGAAVVPQVDDVLEWPALLDAFEDFDRVVVPYELADREARVLDVLVADASSLLVVIGPEGGLSASEVETAVAAGARAISLGPRVFRTETAGLVTVTAARYAAGEI